MHYRPSIQLLCAGGIGLFVTAFGVAGSELPVRQSAGSRYEFKAVHDPNGTGKFYLGREIAQTMGHQGADWLERPERSQEERPNLVIQALELRPGDVVADIGAGSGYYTRRLARQVQPGGRIYAVDIQPEMLERLSQSAAQEGLTNIQTVLGTETDINMPPATLDLALLVDVYHEFTYPYEMIESICAALKPGGRLILLEFRGEDPKVPIKAVHKMTEAQVRRELSGHPVKWVKTISTLPWQHLLIFRKAESNPVIPASRQNP